MPLINYVIHKKNLICARDEVSVNFEGDEIGGYRRK